ncbi:LCI fold-containing protein [Xenorhabdus sp. SGI240]|uniref:LCI fold-containing protein n=1 Tax=Xenorhabdus sp. SGI240 TaxID=3158262 RepID=UPI0032B7112A
MFKKLLTIGALAAGIALTGGIGTASASPSEDCRPQAIEHLGGNLYSRYIVHSMDRFSNAFTENGITWYLKSSGSCSNGLFYGHYEGRRY